MALRFPAGSVLVQTLQVQVPLHTKQRKVSLGRGAPLSLATHSASRRASTALGDCLKNANIWRMEGGGGEGRKGDGGWEAGEADKQRSMGQSRRTKRHETRRCVSATTGTTNATNKHHHHHHHQTNKQQHHHFLHHQRTSGRQYSRHRIVLSKRNTTPSSSATSCSRR